MDTDNSSENPAIIVDAATSADSPAIGAAVCSAIGAGARQWLGGEDACLGIFSTLAARTDSQYSYMHARVARDTSRPGHPVVGVIVGYDGAGLARLRQAFLDHMAHIGRPLGQVRDETDSGEFYIDTLAVDPAYRRRGIARRLIHAALDMAAACGKPAGLLVGPDNPGARALYLSEGFRPVGRRPFGPGLMDHLLRQPG